MQEIRKDADFQQFKNTIIRIVLENREILGLSAFEGVPVLNTTQYDDFLYFHWWASVFEGPTYHSEHVHPGAHLSGTKYSVNDTDNIFL